MAHVESDGAIWNSLVADKIKMSETPLRSRRCYKHMSVRASDINPAGCEGRLEFGEQPVVRSQTSNEEN